MFPSLTCRYYEFEVITTGYMKVGWAKVCAEPSSELGTDGTSYAFDGFMVKLLYIMLYITY